MEWAAKLREEFKKQVSAGGPMPLYDAVVTAVDTDQYTCDIILNEVPVFDVRLRAVVSQNQSIDVLPVVGSAIVVGMMGDDDFLMVAADQITSYRITIGTVVFKLNADGTLISKGTDTLGSVMTDFVNAVLSIAAPKDVPTLTGLLTRINELLK